MTGPSPTAESLGLDIHPLVPRDRSVGIGCVGAGFIMADCHLVAYGQAGFRPVGITSRTRATAEEVAARHGIDRVHDSVEAMLDDPEVEVVDVAVPPDVQASVVRTICERGTHVRGLLAQKPLGVDLAEAREIVRLCRDAGIVLAVNQNMRFDHSVRACRSLLERGELGDPVLATIDMRAIPHWMPWQERQGWVTLRILSIHHLDTLRYWLGDPTRVYASIRPDPRTSFDHDDGIALVTLEFDETGARAATWDDVWAGPCREGAAADIGIHWRVEGTAGMARGSIGWPSYPERTPSTIDFTTTARGETWLSPRWPEAWFPDAFAGPMASLLRALEDGTTPEIDGDDNLRTMAVVEACYVSAREKRVVELAEFD